jgi:hypothetical protein
VKRLVVVAPNWLGGCGDGAAGHRRRAPGPAGCLDLPWAARPSVAPLFTLTPEADEVVTLTDDRPAVPRRREGRAAPAELVSVGADREARARARTLGLFDGLARLPAHALGPAPSVGLHQIAYYQRLVARWLRERTSAPRIDAAPAVREAGAGRLRKAGWDGRTPVVALAPGAAFGSSKRWAPQAFADLAAGLANDGVTTVLVGASADRATAAKWCAPVAAGPDSSISSGRPTCPRSPAS